MTGSLGEKKSPNADWYNHYGKQCGGSLKNLKIELLYDSVISLLGIYPKKPKTLIQKNMCTLMFIAVLFTIAKIWKQPECPSIDKWIKKWYIYTMISYNHCTHKKEQILPFVIAWTDTEGITLSEISRTNKNTR